MMITPQRAQDLIWVEPTFPPRRKRNVIFSLVNHKGSIYFVNNSIETLTHVLAESYGYVEGASVVNSPRYEYADVKPNEGVKIEYYDDIYDLDYMLGLYITVESEKWGKIEIAPHNFSKGGVRAQALVYDDDTTPLFVGLKEIKIK